MVHVINDLKFKTSIFEKTNCIQIDFFITDTEKRVFRMNSFTKTELWKYSGRSEF